MYTDGTRRPAEIILRMGGVNENDGGMNLTEIYCHFLKVTMCP
jgi:hypothetical protein